MAESVIRRANLLVERGGPEARLVLHCDPADAPALGRAGRLDLPAAMLRAGTAGAWRALHLAPDEWLLVGPLHDTDALAARIAEASAPYSLVDVGERDEHVLLSGPAAPALIASGCPLDLHTQPFPPGACTRTLFGKATVVLERLREPDCFRMQYGRSFDGYVVGLIRTAAEDLPNVRSD